MNQKFCVSPRLITNSIPNSTYRSCSLSTDDLYHRRLGRLYALRVFKNKSVLSSFFF